MSETKKIRLELPEGIVLPPGFELPEIEMVPVKLKITKIQDDGTIVEIDEMIDTPVIYKEEQ